MFVSLLAAAVLAGSGPADIKDWRAACAGASENDAYAWRTERKPTSNERPVSFTRAM